MHALVVPREHIATMNDAGADHEGVLGRMMTVAAKVARDAGYTDYRMNLNTNAGAGQSVFHIHLHVLAGRSFGWPPG
jgi:histidine triad (HIT) family protein